MNYGILFFIILMLSLGFALVYVEDVEDKIEDIPQFNISSSTKWHNDNQWNGDSFYCKKYIRSCDL